MKQEDIVLIKCPYCGAEYTISEIYLKQTLEGYSENIIKDEKGHIIFLTDDKSDYKEHFNCDYCHKDFEVNAKINFSYNNENEKSVDDDIIKKKSLW